MPFGTVTGRSKSSGIEAESSCPATSRGDKPYLSCAVCHVKTPFVHVKLVRRMTASSSSVGGRRSTKYLILAVNTLDKIPSLRNRSPVLIDRRRKRSLNFFEFRPKKLALWTL